jgi:hypothetical protein
MMEQTSLAEYSREGYGSKRAVLPIIIIIFSLHYYAQDGTKNYPAHLISTRATFLGDNIARYRA